MIAAGTQGCHMRTNGNRAYALTRLIWTFTILWRGDLQRSWISLEGGSQEMSKKVVKKSRHRIFILTPGEPGGQIFATSGSFLAASFFAFLIDHVESAPSDEEHLFSTALFRAAAGGNIVVSPVLHSSAIVRLASSELLAARPSVKKPRLHAHLSSYLASSGECF